MCALSCVVRLKKTFVCNLLYVLIFFKKSAVNFVSDFHPQKDIKKKKKKEKKEKKRKRNPKQRRINVLGEEKLFDYRRETV